MQQQQEINLHDYQQNSFEIKKHSSLTQIKSNLSLQQRKSINALIRVAKDQLKRNDNETIFKMDLAVIKNLAWIKRKDNKSFKEGLINLMSIIIEYNILGKDKSATWWAFTFLSHVKIEEGSNQFSYEFPKPILDVIKEPSMFVKLDLFVTRGLTSKHSLVLYEVLKDYKNLKDFRIDLESFRKLVGLAPKSYPKFPMLKKRVIDVAIKEINDKTDIRISYELEKIGRKTIAIWFKVKGKNKQQSKEQLSTTIVSKLQKYGFKEYQIKELLQKRDENYLLINIATVEDKIKNGAKIKNITAYLNKAFECDFRPQQTAHEQEQQVKMEQKRLEAEQEEQRKAKLKALETQFNQQRKAKVNEYLNTINENQINALKQQFTEKMNQNDLLWKLLNSKWWNNHIIQAQWVDFVANMFLEKEFKIFEIFKQNSLKNF